MRYTMTAAIWQRGHLENDYGVDLSTIHWVEGAINSAGSHGVPTIIPPGTKFEVNKSGKSMSDLLAEGKVDATIGTHLPDSRFTSPDVVRLFPDFKEVEKAYYKRTGIFPIMHLIAIKRDVYEKNPFIAQSLYRAFNESKKAALVRMRNYSALRFMLPWLPAELDELDEVFGADPWTYGHRGSAQEPRHADDLHGPAAHARGGDSRREALHSRRVSCDATTVIARNSVTKQPRNARKRRFRGCARDRHVALARLLAMTSLLSRLSPLSLGTPSPQSERPTSIPSKPIRVIVPFPPGGGTDFVTRAFAPPLGEALGTEPARRQPQRRAGRRRHADRRAGGQRRLHAGRRRRGDGDRAGHDGQGAVRRAQGLRADRHADRAAVSRRRCTRRVPAKNLGEFVKLVQANPGKYNFGSGAAIAHVSQEVFYSLAKLKMTHVPYRGTGPLMTAILGNEVQVTFSGPGAALPHVQEREGCARSRSRRSSARANCPTCRRSTSRATRASRSAAGTACSRRRARRARS